MPMEAITLTELTAVLEDVETKRFTSLLDFYVKTSALLDRALGLPSPLRKRKQKKYDTCYDDLKRESGAILSRTSLSINYLINFRFRLNGQARGVPEIDQLTVDSIRRVRKQQMEILSMISDDIEVIRDMLGQYRNMQTVMQTNTTVLRRASRLMSVVRDRIEHRPTTLLRLEGNDRKIRLLNQAIETIQTHENRHEETIRQEAENQPLEMAFDGYQTAVRGTWADISRRKERIERNTADMKQGTKLLIRLLTRGYSPLMKRSLNTLLSRHDSRSRRFQNHVKESRIAYFSQQVHSAQ